VREESPNGRANRWLTGDEWVAVAYLGHGENDERGGSLQHPVVFIGGGERERGGGLGPAHQRQPADGLPKRLGRSVRRVPCLGSLTGGPRLVFLKLM
jgi:hypothetical protein